MASNRAAFMTAPKAHPLEVRPSKLGEPSADQILIKNHALAINPIDGKLQRHALYPLTYPTILGQDVAGEVISIGPNITRFQPGDRVLGQAAGFTTGKDEETGFQEYTVLETRLAAHIPANVSYERAVVLPLCLSTAASGLFNKDILNLNLPTTPAATPNGKTILIWGGASSVGSNAIQLTRAAGYEVVTTCSPKNFDKVISLGAVRVFDYASASVVEDIVSFLKDKDFVGAFDAVGGEGAVKSLEVVRQVDGVKIVATAPPGFPETPEGVKIVKVFAPSIMGNGIAKAVYEGFLDAALASGSYVPAPEPLIAGKGLESVQDAIDLLAKGISAQKIVVLL